METLIDGGGVELMRIWGKWSEDVVDFAQSTMRSWLINPKELAGIFRSYMHALHIRLETDFGS